MLFNVPLSYQAKGTPKGKRTPTTERCWEYVEIDIPLYGDVDAPVTIEWNDAMPADATYLGQKDDWKIEQQVPKDGIQAMRYHEGCHYLRHADRLTPESFGAQLHPTSTFFLKDSYAHVNGPEETPASSMAWRQDQEFSTTFDQQLARLRTEAADYFFAGGELYRKASVPVVILKTYNQEKDAVFMTPRIVTKDALEADERRRGVSYRSVCEFQAALNECEDFNGRRRGQAEAFSRPVIHRPDLVDFDHRRTNLVRTVENYIENMSNYTKLKDCNIAYGYAVLDLRRGLAEYHETGNTAELESHAAALVANFEKEVGVGRIAAWIREIDDAPIGISPTMGMRR